MFPSITAQIRVNATAFGNVGALVDDLEKGGFKATLATNGTKVYVTLPSMQRQGAFLMPVQAKTSTLLLNAQEFGGQSGDSGFGIVICDRMGNPLKPFRVTTKDGDANQSHADFAARDSIVAVSARYSNSRIRIIEYTITRDFPIAWLDSFIALGEHNANGVLQWKCEKCGQVFSDQRPREHRTPQRTACEGKITHILKLPHVLAHFQKAVEAAIRIAGCRDCRHVHYFSRTAGGANG